MRLTKWLVLGALLVAAPVGAGITTGNAPCGTEILAGCAPGFVQIFVQNKRKGATVSGAFYHLIDGQPEDPVPFDLTAETWNSIHQDYNANAFTGCEPGSMMEVVTPTYDLTCQCGEFPTR